MSTQGSRGGRANEAGSLYRSGVAAYLAALGLASRGVVVAGYPADAPAPVELSFETGEAVDDIRSVLADGTLLRLQAKRTCGIDAQLTATLVQWVGQVTDLRPGDMIGLVTSEPKGLVRHLGAALDRRRRSAPGPFLAGEKRALEAVQHKLQALGASDVVADHVLDAAVVMTVTVSSERDGGFESVANLLDGTVVSSGSGSAAITALQHAFQQQAAIGAGSGIDEWLQILKAAGLQVYPDAEGAAGPRRRAELDAVAAYRSRLAARGGILEFSLLAEDVPILMYEPLADSFRVAVPERDGDAAFLDVARRWPRLLLTGLPGMGKSTALEQAAARWAREDNTLVPVLVQLKEVAKREPRSGVEVTLPVLIEVATQTAAESERVPLRRALEKAVACGNAVMLLDGLDECRDRRAVVADGLATVLDELPADTGVILTTRDSGRAAAERLSLPEARLAEPRHLEIALEKLLDHIAAHRINEPDRDQWIRSRQERLQEIRESHPDLFRIPLYAMLLTLLLAQRGSGPLPHGRAHLLVGAVRDTVSQWELRRLAEGASRPGMSGGQLRDGFEQIGHVLVRELGGCPKGAIFAQVEAMLTEQWELSRGDARERADEILWFWDEYVGVFVASPATSDIEPRSRIFAEIAEAMWVASQPPVTQREWARAALGDDEYHEAVVLACGLSADAAEALIEAAAQEADPGTSKRALTWAAEAVIEGAQPTIRSMGLLMEKLQEEAAAGNEDQTKGHRPAEQGTRARPGWEYVLKIAMLPLPEPLRSLRDDVLRELVKGEYELAIVTALAALSDAETDGRGTLQSGEAAAVQALLARPLPERDAPLTEPGSRPGYVRLSSRDKLLPGHHEVAVHAARHAGQLGADAATAMYRIAYRGYFRDYERVWTQLRSFGYGPPEDIGLLAGLGGFTALARDLEQAWPTFFSTAASLAPPRPLANSERWRYPDIASLGQALTMDQGSVRGVHQAFTAESVLMGNCMRAVAHAYGLDVRAISAEAAVALEAEGGHRDALDMIFVPQQHPLLQPEVARLDHQDKANLVEVLAGAASDWLVSIAYTLLLSGHDPETAQLVTARIEEIPPDRRANAVTIAVVNDLDPPRSATRLLEADDPLVRIGAASAACLLSRHEGAEAWTSVLARAQGDEDEDVRLAAEGDVAPA